MTTMGYFNPSPFDRRKPKSSLRPLPPADPVPVAAAPGGPMEVKEDKDKEDKEDKSGKFIEHRVTASDDLVELAVRYGTTPETIRRYNRRVVFDYLDNVLNEIIYIPTPAVAIGDIPQPNDDPVAAEEKRKQTLIAKFVEQTGCDRLEARFYLEEANFDFLRAVENRQDDVTWEEGPGSAGKSGKGKQKTSKAKPKPKPRSPQAAPEVELLLSPKSNDSPSSSPRPSAPPAPEPFPVPSAPPASLDAAPASAVVPAVVPAVDSVYPSIDV